MTFSTKSVAHAAGAAVFLLPSFALAADETFMFKIVPLESTVEEIVRCDAGLIPMLLEQNYKDVAEFESFTNDTVPEPQTTHIMVQPETRQWIAVNNTISKGSCIGDLGTNFDLVTKLDEISTASIFSGSGNMVCGKAFSDAAAVFGSRNQYVTMHGVSANNEDFFISRNEDKEWSMQYYSPGLMPETCDYKFMMGNKSSVDGDMLMSVFGRAEEKPMPKCIEDFDNFVNGPMPNLYGREIGSPYGLTNTADKRITLPSGAQIEYCFDQSV